MSAGSLAARLPLVMRAALACALLVGSLGFIVHGRAAILRDGAEVRLRTAPVDPRDLFRGDYVVLSYEISTVPPADAEAAALRSGADAYVLLRRGPDGFAEAVSAAARRPQAGQGEVVIAGRVTGSRVCARAPDGGEDCAAGRDRLRLSYGLESYFVPEGQGRAIERTERTRIEIVAAVSPLGQAAIKRLLIDGRLVHAEPPY